MTNLILDGPYTDSVSTPDESLDARLDRRSNLSYKAFIEEYMKPQKPVVISDAIKDWGALEKWTPEYLKSNYGHKIYTIEDKDMLLGDFIDQVLASTDESPGPYLSSIFIRNQFPNAFPEFPELEADIHPQIKYSLPNWLQHPLLGGMRCITGTELLIGGRGKRFGLHYDIWAMIGFLTQIYGEKEVTLYPPDQSQYLYPVEDKPNWSQIEDIYNPDMERFPLFAEATPIRFILKPGETLFDPTGWWHTTRMLTPSIGVVLNTANSLNWSRFTFENSWSSDNSSMLKSIVRYPYMLGLGAALKIKESISPPA